ncbi:putative disease resistance RPP13-like protein 1 [Zingiber officinale]|uniref:Uncharacterized protein n=1 Tax=Zingiber officinale TaxID=94328 RepID=A0A8J5C6Y5_ZINOF|nr:putative disease resistance RPP13-like protein 1 [Zingiber officinale]KAG6473662.1 hypothetical protein ZIOFF_067579 [Zingiber officinale]
MDWITVLNGLGLPELVKKVVEILLTMAYSDVSRLQGLEDEIDKLRWTHKQIRYFVIDAEERRDIEDESVLRELKTVGFDADDLLDSFQTLIDVFKHTKEAPSRKRKRSWYCIPIPSLSINTGLVWPYIISTETAKIQSRLDKINENQRNLRLMPSYGRQQNEGSKRAVFFPAVASLPVSRIIGRDKEFDFILAAMKADSDLPLRVIAIYGFAGIGKTALAQWVFDHFSENDREEVSPNPSRSLSSAKRHFEMTIWVSLLKGRDTAMATKHVIEGIIGKICKLPNLNHLQDRLKKFVKGKKFLLVLDDVRVEDFKFWDNLQRPLLEGAKGSSVLITTQNGEVSRHMANMPLLHLKGLERDDCQKLFNALAFREAKENVDQLKDIGEQIVRRCQGSPLAAISLGKILGSETTVDNWEIALNEMLALEVSPNSGIGPLLSSFMASYHQMNYQLKQCFTYCSIFPDNFEFDKDQLIRMWIAEGLIEQNGRQPPETIGSELFKYLMWMSFFERSIKCSDGTICKYTMPNLIHDLARLLSKHELMVMKDNGLNFSSGQFRYALLHQKHAPIVFEKIYHQVHLRALKLCNESKIDVVGIPKDLFDKLKYLRVLDLTNSGIEKLPDSVGKLVHLRYLSLSETNIKKLPESVEDLYNLQTLELNFCSNLSSLPEGTSKLVNLRHLGLHLDWEQINDLRRMPTGIDRLTSLMTLSRFTVTNVDGVGCNLKELKNLDLRGELCICKLENVTNASDASEANLGEKWIDKLMLRWSGATYNVQPGANISNVQQDVNICKEVAERLQPYKYLKCVWILNYPGSKFPNWLENSDFPSLETVTLSCSGECESLSSLGQLPKLKHLHIEGMKRLRNLKNMMKGFLSLETLTIKDMPDLNMLCKFKGNFPKLLNIVVSQCPNLPCRRPKDLPRRIKYLIIIPQSTDNVNGNDVSS